MAEHHASIGERWLAATERMGKPAFWASYVLMFLVMFAAFWSGFICHGKGFIWYIDGLEQQYMFFLQEGQWLRDFFANIAAGTFEVPMWSSQIGYGGDYFYSTLNTLGNPINLLSVFAYPENGDVILEATVPLTLFLAGLAFIWYCSYKKFDAHATLLGCFVYVFGGYSFIAFKQIFMLYSLVLAPLVLRGVDRVFDGQSPLGFIIAMALTFLAGVYTGYMVCLMLLVYCIVKFVFLPGEKSIRIFFKLFFLVFGSIVVAALIASVVLLPLATNILSQGRLGVERIADLFYSPQYYAALVQGLVSMTEVGADCITGFASLGFICVLCLFCRKTERTSTEKMLIVLFIVFTLVLVLPIAGRITNGFAYPNNRWVFGYALLVSLITVVEFPNLRAIGNDERRKVLFAALVYVIVCLACSLLARDNVFYIGIAALAVTVLALMAFQESAARFVGGAFATIVLSCLLVSMSFGFSVADQKVDFGKSFDVSVQDDPASLVADLDDATNQTRYDTGVDAWPWRNGNWALGLSGTTFYNSLYNGYIDEYHSSLGLTSSFMNISYCTLNSRTALEALAGVEYFVSGSDNEVLVSPLFDTKVTSRDVAGDDYTVYAANTVIPLAYVEDDAIDRAHYNEMNMVDRQDVMLQAVVLESDVDAPSHIESHARTLSSELMYEAPAGASLDIKRIYSGVSDDGHFDDGSKVGSYETAVQEAIDPEVKRAATSILDNKVVVREPNTVLYLDVDIPANTETYLVLNDLEYEWLSPLDRMDEESLAELSAFGRFKATVKSILETQPTETYLYVYSDGTKTEIRQMNGRNHLYGGKDDWAVNLGYSADSRKAVAIEFTLPGEYSFTSIEVVADDALSVLDDISEVAKASTAKGSLSGNTFTCTVDSTEDGHYLVMRIPYAAGWSATIDGQDAAILRANVGFMAVELPQGQSDIVLTYETPYFIIGLFASFMGIVATVVLCLVMRRLRLKRGL